MTATVDEEIRALAKQATEDAAQSKPFKFWDMSDESLLRIRRDYLRKIEDNPGRPHAMIDRWLASIRWVRLVRWCLHMRYAAVDEHVGTKSWDRYNRFGEPPAYSLALDIDKLRWTYRDHARMPKRGTLRHILDWDRLGDGQPHWLTTLGSAAS